MDPDFEQHGVPNLESVENENGENSNNAPPILDEQLGSILPALEGDGSPPGTSVTSACASPSLSSISHHHSTSSHCPAECTLWMGDSNPEWDQEFIKEAFGDFANDIRHVKLVTDKQGHKATYCFVEFTSEQGARKAMLGINGRTIPNDPNRGRFNLSFANSPNQTYVEYNLSVSNLPPEIDDIALFQLFGERYKSCRGAKVYQTSDGVSKEYGFIRFTDQTDQQQALIELNKHKIKDREMLLRLSQPRIRGGARRGSGDGGGGRRFTGHGGSLSFRHNQPTFGPRGGHFQMAQQPLLFQPSGLMAQPDQYFVQGGFVPVQTQTMQFLGEMPFNMMSAADAATGQPLIQTVGGLPGIPISASYITTQPTDHFSRYGYQPATNVTTEPIMRMGPAPSLYAATGGQLPIVGMGGEGNYLQYSHRYGHRYQPHHQSPTVDCMPHQSFQPILEEPEPISVADHNSMMINASADLLTSLEASRWSQISFPSDASRGEIRQQLKSAAYGPN